MAKKKPVIVGPVGLIAECDPSADALDAKINVSGPDVLLGRKTAGEGGHEQLTISGLPAETTPAAGHLLLAEVSGVLKGIDIADLPGGGGGDVSTDAIWDTKGDLAVGTGSNTAAKLAVGSNGQFLQAASAEISGTKWAATTKVDVFTSSGTWTKPDGAVSVRVICIGGGGGGGSGRKGAAGTVRCGGGGGGGGGRSEATFLAADLSSTEPITVGNGGTGGVSTTTDSTNGSSGNFGGMSYIGGTEQLIYARGGTLGSGGSATAGAGGAGGAGLISAGSAGASANTSGSTGVAGSATLYSGGGGGSGGGIGTANIDARKGGAGGGTVSTYGPAFSDNSNSGSGISGSAGGTEPASFIGQGGAGGNGSTSTNGGNGGNGGSYGGGGGGGGAAVDSVGNSGAGGNGSNGIVIIITYF